MLQLQLADSGDELRGLWLLVVEDDYVVAADMCSALERRGATILGPVGSTRRSREIIREQRPDVVLLDLNLNGTLAFDLAHEFRWAGVPTIFTTGYDAAFLPESLRAAPCMQKPVNFVALIELIRESATAAPVR